MNFITKTALITALGFLSFSASATCVNPDGSVTGDQYQGVVEMLPACATEVAPERAAADNHEARAASPKTKIARSAHATAVQPGPGQQRGKN